MKNDVKQVSEVTSDEVVSHKLRSKSTLRIQERKFRFTKLSFPVVLVLAAILLTVFTKYIS